MNKTFPRLITDKEWSFIRLLRSGGYVATEHSPITAEELDTLLALRAGTARVVAVPRRIHSPNSTKEN